MSVGNKDSEKHLRVCVVNVGLFRSGTTTVTKAAKLLNLNPYRTFPQLSEDRFKYFLYQPEKAVRDWYLTNGWNDIKDIISKYDIICDGWFALLPFLPPTDFDMIKSKALELGIHLKFVATSRDIESTVKSELHHWTIHNLEHKATLTEEQRKNLEKNIRQRASNHSIMVGNLKELGILNCLLLGDSIHDTWSHEMSLITDFTKEEWSRAFKETGIQNANPCLPVEGILLTLRFGDSQESDNKISQIEKLLSQIEEDSICQYLVVLGIDQDEVDSDPAMKLRQKLASRVKSKQQLQSFNVVVNKRKDDDETFNLCSSWNKMAILAWENGASWVVLLGDDVEVKCSYHYRALYRAFLDIAERLQVPFGFGCPWWNDLSFPNFPSFPCVGKTHFEIFDKQLIPEHRQCNFVNQDLDPYLCRLYIKFMAAPCVQEATLTNKNGGNVNSGGESARYERIPSKKWKEFVEEDTAPLKKYLLSKSHGELEETILLDIIVPSYRVRLDYLEKICRLEVPDYMQTLFIIIIDNPDALIREAELLIQQQCDVGDHNDHNTISLNQGETILEKHLSSRGGNNVRVRCNLKNLGASASRNVGLDESSANFVLNLDDDLIPNTDLLERYGRKIQIINDDTCGLVGLVQFPRSQDLPLKHAAVLMSYLTFMFEISETAYNLYGSGPAWGVTANILFRRTTIRFDTVYAKTGGGEDVDFSLRVAAETRGKLIPVPDAKVLHPFWEGSWLDLACHFFNWANGDGALFQRFPEHTYWSFPNAPETFLFFVCPLILLIRDFLSIVWLVPALLGADFFCDISDRNGFKDRCSQLQKYNNKLVERSRLFYLKAHALGNFYVIVLECGRLYGHFFTRKNPLQGLCRRFDWHCGKLSNARRNFRKREAYKFFLYMAIVYLYVWKNTSNECLF